MPTNPHNPFTDPIAYFSCQAAINGFHPRPLEACPEAFEGDFMGPLIDNRTGETTHDRIDEGIIDATIRTAGESVGGLFDGVFDDLNETLDSATRFAAVALGAVLLVGAIAGGTFLYAKLT